MSAKDVRFGEDARGLMLRGVNVLADVVKVNIAIRNIADMAAVDEVYAKFFPRGVPARRVIGVSALPDDALIQIDAVVSNEEGTPPA